jgi:hypothetical protein
VRRERFHCSLGIGLWIPRNRRQLGKKSAHLQQFYASNCLEPGTREANNLGWEGNLMKRLLLLLFATAALAVPAAASAHHGWSHHHAFLAKLSGTGTSFAGSTATASGSIVRSEKLGNGTFAASIASDWTKATSRTSDRGTVSCAPATATLTLTGANTADTTHATLAGKTCKWTPTSGAAVNAFFGRGAVTGTGALASISGTEKAFLVQKADGSVNGAVFAGDRSDRFAAEFAVREHDAAHKAGNCDHH